MPEFPLSLRLIGLRVTKLKDLREDEKRGIKRVRLNNLPADQRDWIPTQLENSSSSQLEQVEPVRTNGGGRAERRGTRTTMTTRPALAKRDVGSIRVRWNELSPHSTSVRNEDRTEQHCPVCSRTLVTDNQGLNEHIDFCLSRDAIRVARSLAGVR
jgi:DNA polymerase kappa